METKQLMSSDLMVGDWILRKNVKEPCPVKVTAIGFSGSVFVDNMHGRTDILLQPGEYEAIPITGKILNKNGFLEDKEYWGGQYKYTYEEIIPHGVCFELPDGRGVDFDGHIKMSVVYTVERDEFSKFCIDVYNKNGDAEMKSFNKYDLTTGYCAPIYVHELQHMLKQCLADKEIIL